MVDDLETGLEDIEEEGGLVLKEGFLMLIFQGIMDELPPSGKYWTHMFQNNYIRVVDECYSKILSFNRLRNDLFSP